MTTVRQRTSKEGYTMRTKKRTGVAFAVHALAAVALVSCHVQDPGQREPAASEQVRELTSEPGEAAVPGVVASRSRPRSSDEGRRATANALDAQFQREARDSAWAQEAERAFDSLMTRGGAVVIDRVVCRTTVCRGTYRFESADDRAEVWNTMDWASLGFPCAALYVSAGGTPPQVQDTYYIRKTPNRARPMEPPVE